MPKQNHKFALRFGAALVASVAGSIASLTPFFVPSATANVIDPITINRRLGADQNICAGELLDRELDVTQVAIACSQALIPADLSFCVTKINRLTNITAIDALNSCTRVRRPVEMATCVVDIYNRSTGSNPLVAVNSANAILDNCRRSLLPLKFADCVVGLSQQIDFRSNSEGVLRTCISAEERR